MKTEHKFERARRVIGQVWREKGEERNDIIILYSQKLKKNIEDTLAINSKGSPFFLEFPAFCL